MNYKCFILHTFLVLEITVSSNTGTAQEKPLFHVQVQPWAQRLTKEDFVLRVSQKKKKRLKGHRILKWPTLVGSQRDFAFSSVLFFSSSFVFLNELALLV